MKKSVAILLVIFGQLTCTAQEKQKTLLEPSPKFQWGMSISPGITDRYLRSPSSDDKMTIQSIREKESPVFGYSGEVLFRINFKENYSFETGLAYAKKGYVFELKDQNLPFEMSRFETQYRFQYFQVPIQWTFSNGNDKLKLIFQVGANLELFLKSDFRNLQVFLDGSRISSSDNIDEDIKYFGLATKVGFGTEIAINKKSTVRIMPSFQIGMFSPFESDFKSHLWNLGLNIGFFREI